MDILKIPNPILTTKAQDLTDFVTLGEILPEFIATAESAGLIGLSAVQCGILQRFFIVDFGKLVEEIFIHDWRVFVNPKITPNKNKGTSWDFEGCGSIPSMQYNVERWNHIEISACNLMGENFTYTLSGLLARVCLHEQDHNNGICLNTKRNRGIRMVK